MDRKYRKLLIDDIQQLMDLPEDAIGMVFSKLEFKRVKRGKVLKNMGEVDRVSRYLCEGFIGAYRYTNDKHSLSVIYRPTDTVFDERSFRSGLPSDTILKCISDVIYYEFSLDSERNVLGRSPELVSLAHKLSLRINERNIKVLELGKMTLVEGYEELVRSFPGLEPVITNNDLAGFFRVSQRTVERFKHNLKSTNR